MNCIRCKVRPILRIIHYLPRTATDDALGPSEPPPTTGMHSVDAGDSAAEALAETLEETPEEVLVGPIEGRCSFCVI